MDTFKFYSYCFNSNPIVSPWIESCYSIYYEAEKIADSSNNIIILDDRNWSGEQ